MEFETLKAETRTASGKGGARAHRRTGMIPGTLYGGGQDAVNVSVSAREFTQLLHGKLGEHAVLRLELAGSSEASTPALIKGVQHHPVRGTVIHADFQRIRLDKPIRTVVPIHVVGRPKGVIEGGVLDYQMRDLEVECLPANLPSFFELDVSDLDIGQSYHVSNIATTEGVTIVTPDHYSVVTVLSSRVTRTKDSDEDEEGAVPAEEDAAAAE